MPSAAGSSARLLSALSTPKNILLSVACHGASVGSRTIGCCAGIGAGLLTEPDGVAGNGMVCCLEWPCIPRDWSVVWAAGFPPGAVVAVGGEIGSRGIVWESVFSLYLP